MSVDLAEASAPQALAADVCVIGSGAGGAVAAAELARGGRSVVVLEQGPHWTSRDFDQREDTMLPRLFEEGGLRQTEDGSVTILQGRNVGGSTVHNLCYAFRTPDPILALWREEYGLASLTPEALAPSFERVERTLKVKPIVEDEVNALNRAIRSGARKLGYSGFVTRHNREGCVRSGYCILGCSYDAKQSMLVTYVPEAERLGARLFASARVERIEAETGAPRARVRRVRGHAVHRDGSEGVPFEVAAKVVVLCAGAIATPDLLLRSGLANSSGQVGRNLHLHPSVTTAGFFEEPLHAYRGIPQSFYVDQFIDLARDPRSGTILMPIAGFPVLTASQLPGFGREHAAAMRRFAHLGGLLALLHDRSAGSVRPGASLARPRIAYALGDEDRAQLAEGALHCVEVLLAGGAQEVLVPWAKEPMRFRAGDDLAPILARGVAQSGPNAIPLASTHPQSTCRMSADPKQGVVGEFGECHDVAGLFVADMSVFPTSLGAPPQITTAALADRTAHHVLERWSELAA